jgi:hypothetical protein
MWTKCVLAAAVFVYAAGFVAAQSVPPPAGENPSPSWRTAGDGAVSPRPAGAPSPPAAGGAGPASRIAKVSTGSGALANEQGQLYREYDISPYTLRVTSTRRPEQAIVDWILRETGYEAWHSEPLAILSATPRKLRVYHTPAVQAVVADIVDRFVNSEAETQAFSLRVVTVDSPNWRSRAQRLLVSIPVQTPGVQAWQLEKEAAALLVADLRRRSDYREQSSPYLMVSNGQSAIVSAMRGKNYIRNIRPRPETWPGFEPETAVIDEGFSLEFNPLLSLDGRMIDAALKCEINQVERLIPVTLNVPTVAAPRQSTKMEVPQVCHFRFHERFRWPAEQVLLVSLGVVAVPVPSDSKPLIPGVSLSLGNSPPRAELLVFVEGKGKVAQSPQSPLTGDRAAGTARVRQ